MKSLRLVPVLAFLCVAGAYVARAFAAEPPPAAPLIGPEGVRSSTAPAAPAKADWNVRDHIPFEKFVIQSHRGAGVLAEEGTMEAFELGWKLGTYPEADLRATKDGVIVTFHDENFARVVKDASPELKKQGVKDLLYDELARLDVGSWKGEQFKGRRVVATATIFELMRAHPERHIYMDVKRVEFPAL